MAWSSIDCAAHCLVDRLRTERLSAVVASVARGAVVLDAGAGTGVLGITAVQNGAKRVIAVERDPLLCQLLLANCARLELSVDVVCADVLSAELRLPKVDVIAAEMLDVWLLEEDLIVMLRSLAARRVVDQSTVIVPKGYAFRLELGSVDWDALDPRIRCPYYEWSWYALPAWRLPVFEPIADLGEVARLDFLRCALGGDQGLDLNFSALPGGLSRVNAVRLSGIVEIGPGTALNATGSMNAPLVLPLRSFGEADWARGMAVSAVFSNGIRSVSIRVGESEALPWRPPTSSDSPS